MTKRMYLLGALTVAGIVAAAPLSHYVFAEHEKAEHREDKDDRDDDDKPAKHRQEHESEHEGKHEEKHGGKHDEDHDRDDDHDREIEQAVPIEMIPPAVADVVKKEVPGGTITEAELEAKGDKIVYAFDVKAADAKYEVKVSVAGKFISKEVDEDEDAEHADTGKTPTTQPK